MCMICALLVSCEFTTGDKASAKSEVKTEPESVFEEEVTVMVPLFGTATKPSSSSSSSQSSTTTKDDDEEEEGKSRGLTTMRPESSPYTDDQDACNIMTSLPVFTNFSTEEGMIDNVMTSVSDLYGSEPFKLLGYGIVYDKDASSVNEEDGSVYLHFYLRDTDSNGNVQPENIGTIDYIYNVKEKKFSYRQSIALSLYNASYGGYYQVSIISLEYLDIPFTTKNGKIEFTFGDYLGNGEFANNAIVDMINLTNEGGDIGQWRNLLTGRMSDGTFYSIQRSKDEYLDVQTNLTKYLINYMKEKNLVNETTASNFASYKYNIKQDTTLVSQAVNLEMLKDIISAVYTNGEALTAKIGKKYTSMEEFDSLSISGTKWNIHQIDPANTTCMDNSVAFNFTDGKSASIRLMPDGTKITNSRAYYKKLDSATAIEKCGFKAFGYTATDPESFLKEHLANCGLSGEGLEQLYTQIKTAVEACPAAWGIKSGS